MSQEVYHIPALLAETIAGLDIKPRGTYVDVTYGGGGHSRAIVEHLGDGGHLYGFDQDVDAVSRATNTPASQSCTAISAIFPTSCAFTAWKS